MSGQHSLRGYIIQSLIAVIDSLNDSSWTVLTIEPNSESEKVDIVWLFDNGNKKVCQIKSSINTFKLSAARKWCEELESSTVNASSYQLSLVGHPEEKLQRLKNIGQVDLDMSKSLNFPSLLDEASTKVDKFYELKGKSKITASVREMLIKLLVSEFNLKAIAGKEMLRWDFEKNLLDWISNLEKQVAASPWTVFVSPSTNSIKPIQNRIVDKILHLIGWDNFNQNESRSVFDKHLGVEIDFKLDYRGELESNLLENTDDFIMITANHEVSYSKTKVSTVEHLKTITEFNRYFKDSRILPTRHSKYTNPIGVHFALSSSISDFRDDYIYEVKEFYKRELLEDEFEYYLVDNVRATFLSSAIIAAKNYRPECPVKFLYPITYLNSSPDRIGKRGFQLPPQYINSSILPIVKESYDKISILLFCADSYNKESLRKLVWLIISLTSGYSNEYIIYFPDYDESLDNEVKDVIRSFRDSDLNRKLSVKKMDRIESDALALYNIQLTNTLVDNVYDFKEPITDRSSKILNRTFSEILPYGDTLMPFLKTDAITANDLKIFLSKKGIYVKNADKKKLIVLITSLLFSPAELEDFKDMIDIKEKAIKSSQEIFKLTDNFSLDNIVNSFPNIDSDTLVENLETKLLGDIAWVRDKDNSNKYIVSIKTEKKDPTNYLSVNTTYGKIELTVSIDGGNVISGINTITHDDKIIAGRLLNKFKEKLIENNIIEAESIHLLFSRFDSNIKRVNFLLSFTHVSDSKIFKQAEIKSIKYKFDKNQDIPESLLDRTERDIVTYLNGRNLIGLVEISDDEFKKILLLDEITISYTYDWFHLSKNTYTVKYNFSNSLYNKDGVEGAFKSEVDFKISSNVKKLASIEKLRKALSNEVEQLKLEKLRAYDII